MSGARTDLKIFGVFRGGGLAPSPESRAGGFRVARNLAEVRRWVVRRGNTRSKSCTRAALCLIPCFLHPYRSCGRAENEREYGGDDEERPSGNNGVDRAERWNGPSGDEVPDHAR